MNGQEASFFSRLRVAPFSPVPPNKAMQTDDRFAAVVDRQGVERSCRAKPAFGRTRARLKRKTLAGKKPRRTMQMYGEEWAMRFEDYANASIAGREGLFRLAEASLADLKEDARILVVGCGTGSEILALASRHAGWQFEAVEPAQEMLGACRQRLNKAEISHRVNLHQSRVEGLQLAPCDAATAILVSQHIVDDASASRFFLKIAENLNDGAVLFSADITLPADTGSRDALLRTWKQQAVTAGLPAEAPASLIDRFGKELLPRSPAGVEELLSSAGFRSPLQVFQSTMYRAWISHLALS